MKRAVLKKTGDYVQFRCPCGSVHGLPIGQGDQPRWDWNGSMEKPTFTPSILVTWGGTSRRCHSFVTDGQIKFEADCSHNLAGKTVPLEPWKK